MATRGEEIVIAKGKEPMVRLTVIAEARPRRVFGALKGKLIDKGLDEPLPEAEIRRWEGDA